MTLANLNHFLATSVPAAICAAVVTAWVTLAAADTILIEDFNDGNDDGWTRVDSNLGHPWGPGLYDASSGSYHLSTSGRVPGNAPGRGFLFSSWDESTDPLYSDGFVRSKVRVDTFDGVAAILFRYSGTLTSGFDGYAFVALAGHGFVYNKIAGTRLVEDRDIDRNLVFGVGEDWWMEGGAIGNQISMKVWKDGDPEPAAPQFTLSDSTYSSGWFAVDGNLNFGSRTEGFVDTTFDDIYFTFPPPLGDFDGDGELLASDIDLLSAALGSRDVGPFDLDNNGAVDQEDRRVWVEELFGTYFGDADLNKTVDFNDFVSLSNTFGGDGGWAEGDFDGNGNVQFDDFTLLASNFGRTSATMAAVPEPNTSILTVAWLPVLACLRRQSRRVADRSAGRSALRLRSNRRL